MPPSSAVLVAMVAKFIGCTEEEILWEMPLSRVHAYQHALYQSRDIHCEPFLRQGRDSLRQAFDSFFKVK